MDDLLRLKNYYKLSDLLPLGNYFSFSDDYPFIKTQSLNWYLWWISYNSLILDLLSIGLLVMCCF
jgi:hypothetical protein